MSKTQNQLQLEHKETLIKQKDNNQREINQLNEKFKLKVIESSNFKELCDQKTQEILNLKKQNEQDKLKAIRTFRRNKYQNPNIAEENEFVEIKRKIRQKEIQLERLERKLDQIKKEKLNESQLKLKIVLQSNKTYNNRSDNIQKHYYSQIPLSVQKANQSKVERLQKLVVVVYQFYYQYLELDTSKQQDLYPCIRVAVTKEKYVIILQFELLKFQ